MLIGDFTPPMPGYSSRHGYVAYAGRVEQAMIVHRRDKWMLPEKWQTLDIGDEVRPPDCVEPDFDVVITAYGGARHGYQIVCGCGWVMSPTEKLFYLDDPILREPIMARLIPSEDSYSLIWDRRAELSYPKGF